MEANTASAVSAAASSRQTIPLCQRNCRPDRTHWGRGQLGNVPVESWAIAGEASSGSRCFTTEARTRGNCSPRW
jgi:hypothetical protein